MHDWKQVFMKPVDTRLYVIHTGYVHMNGNIHFHKKSPLSKIKPKDTRYNPVYCFLVAHPRQGYTLIDTGIHPDFCKKSTGNFGSLLGNIIKVKTEIGQDVISQISSLGLNRDDITRIVITHLHPDHSSGLPLFSSCARCVVHTDSEELKVGNSRFGLFQGYLKRHFSGVRIQHFDYALALKPFDSVADFFGDGSVFIVRTPGHTKGHVSVLLNMQNGPVLIPADVAHRHENIAERIPTVGDYHTNFESVTRLGEYLHEYPATRVIYSHDPDQIHSLKLFPAYYE